MHVRFSPGASKQLSEIFAYIAKDNPAAAGRVAGRIEALAEMLGQNPYTGRVVSKGGVHMLAVTPYPYLIFYEVADIVSIVSVRHAARRRPSFQEAPREFAF